MRSMAREANRNSRTVGLETRVLIHKGKEFDMSKMDATDAVAFVGKAQNVYGEVDKQSASGQDFGVSYNFKAEAMVNGFGSVTANSSIVPEVSAFNGNTILIATEALAAFSKSSGVEHAEAGGFTIVHGAGHNAGLNHSGDNATVYSGTNRFSIPIPFPSVMSSGDQVSKSVNRGESNFNTFVSTPNNNKPLINFTLPNGRNLSYIGSVIYNAFIQRFSNEKPSPKLPVE